jgi:hypothetical protein
MHDVAILQLNLNCRWSNTKPVLKVPIGALHDYKILQIAISILQLDNFLKKKKKDKLQFQKVVKGSPVGQDNN